MVLKPDLNRLQNIVFDVIKRCPGVCNHEISVILCRPINTITPRVNELRKKGLVVFSHYKVDRNSNMRVMSWKPVTC